MCFLEAGLQERLWTELHHRASLRGGGIFREAVGDVFFVFTFSHLLPAFLVLIVRYVLSSAVFIAELILKCICKSSEKRIRH
jgi:hypothetical protein